VGLAVAATAHGLLFRTRWLPVLVDVGLVTLAAGTGLLLLLPGHDPAYVVGGAAFLLGLGAGATVSPGLFLAALGVPSARLGRAFALVVLLRAVAAFAVGPAVLHVAQGDRDLGHGVRVGLTAMLVLAILGLVAALLIPALSGARLREPDLEAWLECGERGLPSPKAAVHVRSGSDEAAEPLVPERLRRRAWARRS
jgi:MFS family permease